jgi:hypothetical protein
MKGKEKQVANALAKYVKDYDLDGVDVDFEDEMTVASIEWLISVYLFERRQEGPLLTLALQSSRKSSEHYCLLHNTSSVMHLRHPGWIQRRDGQEATKR